MLATMTEYLGVVVDLSTEYTSVCPSNLVGSINQALHLWKLKYGVLVFCWTSLGKPQAGKEIQVDEVVC